MRHQNVCSTVLEHGRWFGGGVDLSVILVVIERWTSQYVGQYTAQVCSSEPPSPVSLHLRKKDDVLVSSEFDLVRKNAFSRGLSVSAGCATAKL